MEVRDALMRERKKPAGISTLPASVYDNKKIRRCFGRILITLNLGIFGKARDHFRAELPQLLKRFVSFTEFSFDLRGFQLSSLW